MIEITIHVPGLEKLADALLALAPNGISSGEITPHKTTVSKGAVTVPNVPAATTPTPAPPVTPTQAAPTPAPVPPVTQKAPIQAQTPVVPTTQTAYKMDDLSVAAIRLIESGKLSMEELQQIMAGFGVASLPELPETQYGTFASILRQKGANI